MSAAPKRRTDLAKPRRRCAAATAIRVTSARGPRGRRDGRHGAEVAGTEGRSTSLEGLAPFEDDCVLVVIETPKGSPNKLTFEPRYGTFVLKGVLPAGAVFPFDFGFVPSTRADDGDPLDVLVLMDAPVYPGCIVPARLIGVIEAEQTEAGETERNDRLLAHTFCRIFERREQHRNCILIF